MHKYLLVFSFIFLFACGKVAQDISEQSTKSIFESATLTMDVNLFSDVGMWDTRLVTKMQRMYMFMLKDYCLVKVMRKLVGLMHRSV